MTCTVLHIDSSARRAGSTTRELSQEIVKRLSPDRIVRRDLSSPLPQITEDWIGANFTPAEHRDPVQRDLLTLSDSLVEELRSADVIVIGLPVYNFSVPASFKAWIDLIARVGQTFRYTENGPIGLLTDKRVILAVASGGTAVGSEQDFATDYTRHVLGFVGLTEIEIVAADQMAINPEGAMKSAQDAITQLAA